MHRLALLVWMAPVLALAAPAEDAVAPGRLLDFQTPNQPGYVAPELREEEGEYRLPSVPLAEPGQPEDRPLSEAPRFLLRGVRVEGAEALPEEAIREITAGYLNREVTTEDLQTIRLALSRVYVTLGYVNSGVVIPDQRVEDGVVTMQAIEGDLTRIEIEGSPRLRNRYIESRLRRRIDDPLNVIEIQQALQSLQQDPNIVRLDARLAPGEALGESVLRVGVDEPGRFEAELSADNHRASSVGAERGRLTLRGRNLTGLGESIRISGALSEGSNDADASLSVPLNRWETRLQGYYVISDTEVIEEAFEELDIRSETETWGVQLSQPLVDGSRNDLTFSLGFESRHNLSEIAGVPFSFSPGAIDGESDTRAAFAGLDWTVRGANTVLSLRGTYRRGLDVMDATEFVVSEDPQEAELARLANPGEVDGEFTSALFQGLFLQRLNALPGLGGLPDRGQLVIRATSQLAFDPLMSIEKIAIGGVNTVRGYPENLLVRDNGVAASLELQFPFFGYRSDPHPLNLVLAPFVDWGQAWDEVNTDPTSTVRNTEEKRYVASAGVGLQWRPLRGLNAQVYWGADISDNFEGDDPREVGTRDSDLQDDGIHFSVSWVAQF